MTIVAADVRDHIERRVQLALNPYQPRRYEVRVDPEGILEDDGWYHVVIKSPGDVRDRDFYDALASAESDLNDVQDGHQYLLVPAIAD